jgi:hypothetical protein
MLSTRHCVWRLVAVGLLCGPWLWGSGPAGSTPPMVAERYPGSTGTWLGAPALGGQTGGGMLWSAPRVRLPALRQWRPPRGQRARPSRRRRSARRRGGTRRTARRSVVVAPWRPIVRPAPPASPAPLVVAPAPPASPAASLTLRQWVTQELTTVSLRDTRLERRLRTLVTQLAQQPTASIPQACGSWKDTKAAYRFFANPKVSHAAILAGHRPAVLERMADEDLVLAVQDTTSLDYTHHPQTRDLGPLEHPAHQGLLVHSSLAVSAAGVPLGLLDQQVGARDPATTGKKHHRKKRPIEEKESFKWLLGLRATLPDLPATVCVVTVADREADIFDFFLEAEQAQDQGPYQVLVRAAWNRRLTDPPGYLWDEVARTPVQGTSIVEVGRAKDRLPRSATVTIRFAPVTVRQPSRRLHEPGLHPLPLYAIEVREPAPPPGEKALQWLLLTNRPVHTFAAAHQCVRWYGLRWLIERYHFVLKSGCRIEARQLSDADRLQRCLGVYAIVAWRLLWLTYQARTTPDAPCTVALETHEWQALYCYIHKTQTLPEQPPSLHQAIRWIAQLGGFLGRRHDGQPGVKVLWRGWQRLHDITETWLLFHPPPDVGNA